MLSFPDPLYRGGGAPEEVPWERVHLSTVNFLATNLRELGKGHAIHPDVERNDGKLGLVWAAADCSRANLLGFTRQMKKGGFLKNCRKMQSARVTEFKLEPINPRAPCKIARHSFSLFFFLESTRRQVACRASNLCVSYLLFFIIIYIYIFGC